MKYLKLMKISLEVSKKYILSSRKWEDTQENKKNSQNILIRV
jgi:hypothetical protein